MTLAYHYVLPMNEIASASSSSKDFRHAVAAVYCDHLLGRPGFVGVSLLVMCSTFISLNGNALTGPRAYFAMARDGLFPGRTLPGPPPVSDSGQCRSLARDLGHPLDARRHVLDRRAADGRAGLASIDRGRVEKAQRDSALRPALQLRHLRGKPLLHAGHFERVRAAHPPARPAAAVPHLGLSAHPAPLRGRGASCSWETWSPTIRAGCSRSRESASSCSACRPTGCFGAITAKNQ